MPEELERRSPASLLRVRPAQRSDIPAIAECDRSSTTDDEVVGFGAPVAQRLFASVGRLAAEWKEPNRVGSEEVLVAELDGLVVGFVTVEFRSSELELVNIDVRKEHRRRGIGSQLVHWVEDLARKERRTAVTLGTSRNAQGVPWTSFSWWIARGYRVTGEIVNDWTRGIGPGVREIRMRKELT
jgi:ribosomal protein S18 acetylase RimI-like enzyme